MLLNMERSADLFDVELHAQFSYIELKPESHRKEEEAFLLKPLEENSRSIGRKCRDGDLVEEAGGTGLTPRIDFRMELDSWAEERLGLSSVDVVWVVVLMAILASLILGISRLRVVGFLFILLL